MAMLLVMRLDGKEIARQQYSRKDRLSRLVDALRKRYKDEIRKAATEPEFFLEGVATNQSSQNN